MTLILATSVFGKSVAKTVVKKFSGAVVERWTHHRANRFFEGFVETVGMEFSTGVETEEVDRRLTEILSDDTKSEILFDAYRRVCFSKSKTIGPRIIGLLTGRLVHDGSMADHTEESIFEAAESLSDGDFIEFMKTYQEYRKKAEGITNSNAEHHMLGDSVIIRWSNQSSESSSRFGHELDIGPFPWDDALGRWAVKLKATGLLEERVLQSSEQHSRPHEDERITSTKITTTITFCSGCARLYDLLSRSLGPET